MLAKLRAKLGLSIRSFDVKDALQRLRPRERVMQAARDVSPALLIDRYAALNNENPRQLLVEVAAELSISAALELQIPTPMLLGMTGYQLDALEPLDVLPQIGANSAAGYVLVVADPSLVAVEHYERRGVQVFLGLGSHVREMWRQYKSLSGTSAPQLLRHRDEHSEALSRLISAADRAGASELFLGSPTVDQFEYVVDGQKHTGEVEQEIYRVLLQAYGNRRNTMSLAISNSVISSANVALTRNADRPVFYISWHRSNSLVPLEESQESEPEEVSGQTELFQGAGTTIKEELHEGLSALGHRTSQVSAAARNILLVDDDEQLKRLLVKILSAHNWNVRTEHHGASALYFIAKGSIRPDLVICDVHMPHMNGVEFLKILRGYDSSIPVVMLTSDVNPLLEAELALMGADAFVRKQEDPRALLAWCRNLLSRGAAEQHSRGAAEQAGLLP